MIQFLQGIVSEDSKISTMRVMSFLSLFAGFGVIGYALIFDKTNQQAEPFAILLISSAFSGKVLQKFSELKNQSKVQNNTEEK